MISTGSVSFKNTALKQISPLWSRLGFSHRKKSPNHRGLFITAFSLVLSVHEYQSGTAESGIVDFGGSYRGA